MKRFELVQLTLIIVGVISAFLAISASTQLISLLFIWFSEDTKDEFIMLSLIQFIILLATYLLLSIYAIKNSKQWAEKISQKAKLQADINFALNKQELLFALFTGLGIYGLIGNVPVFLKDLFLYIQSSNNSLLLFREPQIVTKSSLFVQVFEIGLYFILLYYAAVFSEFLAARMKDTEPAVDINNTTEP